MTFDARTIAQILGGEANGNSVSAPGPGHPPKDRSLSILIEPSAPGGFILTSFSSRDDWRACRDYVRGRLGLEPWKANQDRRKPLVVINQKPDENKEKMKRIALDTWQQSVSPAGSIVDYYLREHRGLTLDDARGDVIRFHGSLYFDQQTRLPGMVCLLRNIFTDEPCGIHRTFLNRETGQKVDRKMLGIAKEAAIKLDSDFRRNVAASLTIGEGVETVLSARAAGLGPAWALGSSGAVRAFPALPELVELTILEENDPTSRRDVKACAKRYLSARKPVNIVTSHVGNDMNDAWRAMK